MTILNWFLYLGVTLLMLFPFILLTASSIISSYFVYKERHIAKTAKALGEAILEHASQMKAKKEKENG